MDNGMVGRIKVVENYMLRHNIANLKLNLTK
jgi:hypothetical protein